MHRTTPLGTARRTLTTQLTTQHKLTLICENALMIRLNHIMGLDLSRQEPQHNMQLMHFSAPLSEQRVSRAASIAAQRSRRRHAHIANDDTKQLQDSKQMHACFSPELFS